MYIGTAVCAIFKMGHKCAHMALASCFKQSLIAQNDLVRNTRIYVCNTRPKYTCVKKLVLYFLQSGKIVSPHYILNNNSHLNLRALVSHGLSNFVLVA